MNKKFELLKELLLLREAGAYDIVHNSIDLALDIYCDDVNIDKDKFVEELKKIHSSVWNYEKTMCDREAWKNTQQTYEMLLNILEVK